MKLQKLTAVMIFSLIVFISKYCEGKQPEVQFTKEPQWITRNVYNYSLQNLDKEAQNGIVDLVSERQIDLNKQAAYHKIAFKILSEAGVQNNSQVSVNYDPSYSQLDFHSIKIVRGGQIINKLEHSKIKIIHQENNLEKFIYNGSVSAVLILEDVRKGDIIEYTYTIKGFNPIFKNIFTDDIETNFSVPLYYQFYKLIVPPGHQINFKNNSTPIQPVIKHLDNNTVYEWSSSNISGLSMEDNVPSWYNPYGTVFISEYKNWKEVNDVALSLFPFNIPLSNELRNKISLISKLNSTSEEKISAALRFVQDDIRYMGIEMGINSHKPHNPDQIYKQRFGDCKDKSYLLCTILRNMGIDANPVLINSSEKHALTDKLPSMQAFDHTTVLVCLNNRKYYFDPTISYQRGTIDKIAYPDYQTGLVLSDTTTSLSTIPYQSVSKQEIHEIFNIPDMNGTADFSVNTHYSGRFADDTREYFKTNSIAEIEKNYLKHYSNYFGNIIADSLTYTEDEKTGEFIANEYYHINDFWGTKSSIQKVTFEPFEIELLLKKPKEIDRTMPYNLHYPSKYSEIIDVNLPESWNSKKMGDSIGSANFSFISSYTCIGSHVTIKYSYENYKDHVAKNELKDYINTINKSEENTSYYLSSTKSNTSTGPASTTNSEMPTFPSLYLVLGLCVFITFMIRKNRRSNSV